MKNLAVFRSIVAEMFGGNLWHLLRSFLGHWGVPGWRWMFTVALLCVAVNHAVEAQVLRLDSFKYSSTQGAQFNISANTNLAQRVDFSPNLTDWLPLGFWLKSTKPVAVVDPGATNDPGRYYRAVSVDPVPGIYSFDPDPVLAGSMVTITGQFFATPTGANRVTIGGLDSTVIAVDSQHLHVTVPPNGVTGALTVTTPVATVTAATPLTVLRSLIVQLAPPPGLDVSSYELLGPEELTQFTNGIAIIAAPSGMPSIIMASSRDTNRFDFFAGLVPDGATNLVLDAQSTARALVFMHPLAANSDPAVAAQLASIIAGSAKVVALGNIWSGLVTKPGNPLQATEFVGAYQDAVVDVLSNPALVQLAQARDAARVSAKASSDANVVLGVHYLEPVNTRWLEVPKLNSSSFVVDKFPFNPVDWVIRIQEMDVDRAFPNGRFDLQDVLRQKNPPPIYYPLRPGLNETRTVDTDLAAGRINFISYLSKELFKLVAGKGPDTSVYYYKSDTIYVVRGIGPSFLDQPDIDFATAYYPDEHNRAIAVNLAAAVMDLISALLDAKKLDGLARSEGLLDWDKFYLKLVDEASKYSQNVRTPEDFAVAATKLAQFFFKELISNLAKAAAKSVKGSAANAAFLAKLGDWGATVGSLGDGAESLLNNKYLKVGSSLGQVAERASGMLRTTAVETSLVVVGDPFRLTVVSVTPAIANLGADLTVVFRGSTSLRTFDTNNVKDTVTFEGPAFFDGVVTGASGPDPAGLQTLKVHIPVDLANAADGDYQLYITTQGRRGSAPFHLALNPSLTALSPTNGFPATDNFDGSSFIGTELKLLGVNISDSDRIFFKGTNGLVEALSKFTVDGGVGVYVPAGAVTGPIRLDHRDFFGKVTSATSSVFQIIGPPVIQSVVPTSGSPGNVVVLHVLNTGNSGETVRVRFAGGNSSGAAFSGPDTLVTTVPAFAVSGDLMVVNPSGSASQAFSVTPSVTLTNLFLGSSIQVGGSSVVTMQRALDFASGDGYPNDDTDTAVVNGQLVLLDPPYEEGDFVFPDNIQNPKIPRFVLGLNYADRIYINATVPGPVLFKGIGDTITTADGVTIAGDLTVAGLQDSVYGSVGGTTAVSGHYSTLDGDFAGPVIISGNSNRITGTFHGPVLLTGTYNFVDGEFYNTITVAGNFNNVGEYGGATVQGCTNAAILVTGNQNNVIAHFINNRSDAIRVVGGAFNQVTVQSALTNGGNGITLTGGASNNSAVVIAAGVQNPATGSPFPGTGIARHGIALVGSATFNSLGGSVAGNGVDGVNLDGPGVHDNAIDVEAVHNSRNGVTITNLAHDNILGNSLQCNENERDGLAIYDCTGTVGTLFGSGNGGNGLVLSGVVEDFPGGTDITFYSNPFANTKGNGGAAVLLEDGTQGVHVGNLSSPLTGDTVGVELDGADVQFNEIECLINGSLVAGVWIHQAAHNTLHLVAVKNCADTAILLDGAAGNEIQLGDVTDNGGPGMLFTRGAAENVIRPAVYFSFVTGNDGAVVMQQGSHDNFVQGLTASDNGDYGVLMTGMGTANNQIADSVFVGAKKDGARVEAGASGNILGTDLVNNLGNLRNMNFRDAALSGVRITGVGTVGNAILNCMFTPTDTNMQPAGVLVEDGASGTIVQANTFYKNVAGLAVRDGATATTVLDNLFESNSVAGIVISNANTVIMGGNGPTDPNEFYGNLAGISIAGDDSILNVMEYNNIHDNTDGILIKEGSHRNSVGAGNLILHNGTGIRLDGASTNEVRGSKIDSSFGAGIEILGGAVGNVVVDSQVINNVSGVHVTGADSIQNRVVRNSITGNNFFAGVTLPGVGIVLAGGGNNGIPAPQLLELQGENILGSSPAPDGSMVEVFTDPGDEGQTFVGAGEVVSGHFRVPISADPLAAGFLFNLTATVTDPDGNTSPFGLFVRPDFPPSKIVFSSTRSGNSEIYKAGGSDAAGAPANLTLNSAKDESPAAVAGCDKVLFVSDRSGNRDIYSLDLKQGGGAVRLTTATAADYDPAWLVLCEKIVFTSERDGNAEIYSMNADGSSQTRLTTSPGVDRYPRPSPDGSQIVFVSTRTGTASLWIMNADGSNQRLLGSTAVAGLQPVWSPDGSSIAFSSTVSGNFQIYVVDVTGANLRQVTSDTSSNVEPAWTPGGASIVYASNRSGNYELYMIPVGGGIPARLTVSTGDNRSPVVLPR